jgi:hypothetical protein
VKKRRSHKNEVVSASAQQKHAVIKKLDPFKNQILYKKVQHVIRENGEKNAIEKHIEVEHIVNCRD